MFRGTIVMHKRLEETTNEETQEMDVELNTK